MTKRGSLLRARSRFEQRRHAIALAERPVGRDWSLILDHPTLQ